MPPVSISHVDGRSDPDTGRAQSMNWGSALLRAIYGELAGIEAVVASDAESGDEARLPRIPYNTGRPTKQEIAEHCFSH